MHSVFLTVHSALGTFSGKLNRRPLTQDEANDLMAKMRSSTLTHVALIDEKLGTRTSIPAAVLAVSPLMFEVK